MFGKRQGFAIVWIRELRIGIDCFVEIFYGILYVAPLFESLQPNCSAPMHRQV